MPHKHQYIWAAVIGVGIGMYLAGAVTGTGIYSSFIGQTAANLWTSGNNAATGSTPAAS